MPDHSFSRAPNPAGFIYLEPFFIHCLKLVGEWLFPLHLACQMLTLFCSRRVREISEARASIFSAESNRALQMDCSKLRNFCLVPNKRQPATATKYRGLLPI